MDHAPCLRRGGGSAFPSEDRANAGYHIDGSYDGPVVRRQSAADARGARGCTLSPPPAANNREADSTAHGHGDSEHAESSSRDDAGAGERVALPVGRRVRVESGRCASDRQHDTADRDRDKQQSEQARTPVPPMRVLYS